MSTDKQHDMTTGDLQKLIERAADARNCALARYSNQSRKVEDYAAVKFQPSEFRQRSGI